MGTAINQSVWDASNTTYDALFADFFAGTNPGSWSQWTSTFNADTQKVEIPVSTYAGGIAQWIGAKTFDRFRAYRQQIPFTKWQRSTKIQRADMAYDKIGMIKRAFQEFLGAQVWAKDFILHQSLVSASGAGPTGYDTVALISTAHPNGPSGNQSNKSTSALTPVTYNTAKVAMRGFRKESGEPYLMEPTHLMVGPTLEKIAKEITQSNVRVTAINTSGVSDATSSVVAAGNIPNVFGGGEVELIINPRLTGTSANYYYLMDLSKPMKPMQLVIQRDMTPVYLDRIEDINRFMNDDYLYSIEADMTPAAGAWPTLFAGIL